MRGAGFWKIHLFHVHISRGCFEVNVNHGHTNVSPCERGNLYSFVVTIIQALTLCEIDKRIG